MSLKRELLQRISTAGLTIKFLRFTFSIFAQLLHQGTLAWHYSFIDSRINFWLM